MNPKVDEYLSRAKQWREETAQLRRILLDCSLTEELKWGKLCYAFEGANVIVIQGFKAYCALLFFKGFMLKDPHGILVKTGVNTRVGRQIRFTDIREIVKMESVLKTYIQQAIAVEKSGLNVDPPKSAEPKMPEELQKRLREDPAFKKAFKALTPGRQRGYSFYISGAKQSKTRASRIEKCRPQILQGKGFNE
jgi:uncharacterized protein YdeI (YjbR/CyaY-like superfamily)